MMTQSEIKERMNLLPAVERFDVAIQANAIKKELIKAVRKKAKSLKRQARLKKETRWIEVLYENSLTGKH